MSHEIASADALMRANADLSRQIGELNTTIGYQDAKIRQAEMDAAVLRGALLRCYDAWTPPVPDWLIEAATGQLGQQAMEEVVSALAIRAALWKPVYPGTDLRICVLCDSVEPQHAPHCAAFVTAQRPPPPTTSRERDQPAVTPSGADTAGETQP